MTFPPIPELSNEQAAVMLNIDELVELGIPRKVAAPTVEEVIRKLDTVYEALDDFDKLYPSLNQRTLAKALFIGGLVNFSLLRVEITQLALSTLVRHYQTQGE